MTDDLLTMLADYGGMGLFACYLIWQRKLDAARLDQTIQGFRDEEAVQRARWDAVVDKIDAERRDILGRLEDKMDELSRLVEGLKL